MSNAGRAVVLDRGSWPGIQGTGGWRPEDRFVEIPADAKLAVAKGCLKDEPFGFTREDVRVIREAAADIEAGNAGGVGYDKPLLSLAARIEALLLPETTPNG